MKITHLKTTAQILEQMLKDYISGKMAEKQFIREYPTCLEQYVEVTDEQVHWPLDLLVPMPANSERAWKENMIAMYQQQLQDLESQLGDDEESYAEKLGSQERKSLCQDGINSIRKQVQNLTAKSWIYDNLVDDVEFKFTTLDGDSVFGARKTLYSTPILNESFLLTALSNVMVKPPFAFQQLILAIRQTCQDTRCFWARCSENDGAFADVKVISDFTESAFDQLDQLAWIEHTTGSDTQWGACHLLLMPADYSWMLKITNDFRNLSIELHGDEGFIDLVLQAAG
jgi:hypothetical protein